MATSPTVRQRELGKRLRDLRNQHGLTVEDVAEKLLCSATKISRLETGARRPSFRDVRDLCGLYGLDDPTSAEFMDLAREAREKSGGLSTMISKWTLTSGSNRQLQLSRATRCTTYQRCCRPKNTPGIIKAIAPKMDSESTATHCGQDAPPAATGGR